MTAPEPIAGAPATEEELRSVVDAMAEGVVLVDAAGRVAEANPAAAEIMGATPEDLAAALAWEVCREDGTPLPQREWSVVRTRETGEPRRRVLTGLTGPDGRRRWLEISTEAVRGPGDAAPYPVVMTFADVTERVEAEHALRASEERFRSLYESMGEGLAVFGPDDRIEMANPAAARLLGVAPGAFAGHSLAELGWVRRDAEGEPVPPGAGPTAVTRATGRRLSGVLVQLEGPDGRRWWLEISTAPVGPGPPYRVLTTFSDVSARVDAERALRESERRHRLLADHAGDMVLRHLPDTTILYASPATERVLGVPPGEMIGRRTLDVVHPDDLATLEEAMSGLAAQTGPRTMTMRARRPDGAWYWFEATYTPVRDDDGVVTEVVSVTRDVSAQVAADEALRESEERLRLLAEHASDIIARYGLDGRLRYISPACERILGRTQQEMLGSHVADWVHADDQPVVAAILDAHRRGEPVEPARVRIVRSDGSPTWVEASFALVHGAAAGGEVVVIVRDANAQVAAERELAESEERYRLVAENASDMIARHAPDGRFLWVSPSALRITGYTPGELEGRSPLEFVHPDDREKALISSGRLEEGPALSQLRTRHKDGRWLTIEVTYNSLHDEDGSLREVHTTFRDVTARVEREDLERAQRREREELMAVVSHELRAPLGALDGLLWLISEDEGGLPERGRGRLESARARLARLRRLANDLVVMTQLDAGALHLDRGDVDLGELVRDAVESARAEADRAGVRLEADVRRTPVLADAHRVAQVLDNLLANAITFSPPGGTVQVRAAGDFSAGRIVVADEGPGVPPAERERVFERFHRAASAAGVPGSGLGLAIARGIAEAHGGRISLQDGPGGRGLCAVLELPRE